MDEIESQLFSPQKPKSKRMIVQIESSIERWTSQVPIWQPPTDLYEAGASFVVRVEIAGMQDSEINVSLEGRTLVVSGVRVLPNVGNAFYQMEISTGDFITAVDLPGPILIEEIEAEYFDGFLVINLPKDSPKKVDVNG